MVDGAAPESNRPSRGLHDRTGFEDSASSAQRSGLRLVRASMRASRDPPGPAFADPQTPPLTARRGGLSIPATMDASAAVDSSAVLRPSRLVRRSRLVCYLRSRRRPRLPPLRLAHHASHTALVYVVSSLSGNRVTTTYTIPRSGGSPARSPGAGSHRSHTSEPRRLPSSQAARRVGTAAPSREDLPRPALARRPAATSAGSQSARPRRPISACTTSRSSARRRSQPPRDRRPTRRRQTTAVRFRMRLHWDKIHHTYFVQLYGDKGRGSGSVTVDWGPDFLPSDCPRARHLSGTDCRVRQLGDPPPVTSEIGLSATLSTGAQLCINDFGGPGCVGVANLCWGFNAGLTFLIFPTYRVRHDPFKFPLPQIIGYHAFG